MNVSKSLTAMSDSIFRFKIIFFFFEASINEEYLTSRVLRDAFILEIQRDLKDLFLIFLSLNAYCKDLIFDCFAVLKSLLLAP